jgi:hypothetical protein
MVANAKAKFILLPEQNFKLMPRWDKCANVLRNYFKDNNTSVDEVRCTEHYNNLSCNIYALGNNVY